MSTKTTTTNVMSMHMCLGPPCSIIVPSFFSVPPMSDSVLLKARSYATRSFGIMMINGTYHVAEESVVFGHLVVDRTRQLPTMLAYIDEEGTYVLERANLNR